MFGRFGVVFQKDSMQCGVACLAMVCRHFGRRYSLGFLETVCSPTTEGVSLKGIADGARELGFETAAGLITADRLREAPLPCVLHWDQNHFTVLYKVTRRRWHVADPAKGRMAYTQTEFEKHWVSTISEGEKKGIALLLEPGKDVSTAKRSDGVGEKRSFRFLFRHIGQYRKSLPHPHTDGVAVWRHLIQKIGQAPRAECAETGLESTMSVYGGA